MSVVRWLVVVVAVGLLTAPMIAPPFWITLLNYIGLYSIVALGLVLLTGVAGQTSFGQQRSSASAPMSRPTAITIFPALSPRLNLLAGVALTMLVPVPRVHHAAHERPLPAAGDDRMGHQSFLHLRQSRIPRRAHGTHRDTGAEFLRTRIAQRALLLLPHLGDHAGIPLDDAQSARFASRQGGARAQGRPRNGGSIRL